MELLRDLKISRKQCRKIVKLCLNLPFIACYNSPQKRIESEERIIEPPAEAGTNLSSLMKVVRGEVDLNRCECTSCPRKLRVPAEIHLSDTITIRREVCFNRSEHSP